MSRKMFVAAMVIAVFRATVAESGEDELVALVKQVKPSVVMIQTYDANNRPLSQGTGFFVDQKGSVVTNWHVIEGAYSATVRTSAGREYPVMGLAAKDASADLARLAVNLGKDKVKPLMLSTETPDEGQSIIVIGNPMGLEATISTGIVSGVRDVPGFGSILQITAPVSPGSSGSPVMNSKGEVIGVATLIITTGQNLNFAVPSKQVRELSGGESVPELTKGNAGAENGSRKRNADFRSQELRELPEGWKYSNREGHFSFIVPAGWVQMTGDDVKKFAQGYSVIMGTPCADMFVAGFYDVSVPREPNTSTFRFPCLLVLVASTEGRSGWILESLLSKDVGKKETNRCKSTVEKSLRVLGDEISWHVSGASRKRHTVYGSNEMNVPGTGAVVGIYTTYIGDKTMVTLQFYERADDPESTVFTDIFRTNRSFGFDRDYSFKERPSNRLPDEPI